MRFERKSTIRYLQVPETALRNSNHFPDSTESGVGIASMNAVMERFLDECRAEPFFIEHPDQFQKIEDTLEAIYEESNERAGVQELCDRVCSMIGDTRRPFSERLFFFQGIRLVEQNLRAPLR
jgi:hypothetical protein